MQLPVRCDYFARKFEGTMSERRCHLMIAGQFD